MIQRNSKYSFRNMLRNLLLSRSLTEAEAKALIQALIGGRISGEGARALLILMRQKGESCDEICGAISAIRASETEFSVDLPYLVDNCGTGGDGKGTINVSTISAFVAAAGGATVAKHGNRSVSSRVGSADLLESLGVNLAVRPRRMIEILRRLGIGYFHAPLYHSSLRGVQGIRKSIRGRTIFNLLGPLLNPLRVRAQVIGVCHPALAAVVAGAAQRLGTDHTFVICGEGGMDEATPYGTTEGFEVRGREIRRFRLIASHLGFCRSSEREVQGGTLRRNRALALGILKGEVGGPKKEAVILNAGLALLASGRSNLLEDAVEMARSALESGGAYRLMARFVEMTHV